MFEIGNTLREARVRRNLTLQQVEEDTKIRVKYVQAMENEDWDVLPGHTYVKGFLRSYSSYLGLDADLVMDEFRSRGPVTEEVFEDPFGGASVIGKPHSHRARNTILFVAVICLLVLGIIYVLGMNSGTSEEPKTKPGALGITSESPTPTKTPGSGDGTVKPGLKNVLTVEVTGTECWVEVRRDGPDGVKLYSGTMENGHRKSWKGAVLWFTLGTPSAVEVLVQGKKTDQVEGDQPADFLYKNGKLARQD